MYRHVLFFLIIIFAATGSFATDESDEMKELNAQFEQRILDKLEELKNQAFQDIQKEISEIANSVYSGHREILKAEAKAQLEKLPVLSREALDGYKEIFAKEDILEGMDDANLYKNMLLPLGWQPHRIAIIAKTMCLSQKEEPQDIGKLAIIEQYLPDKVHLLKKEKRRRTDNPGGQIAE